MDFRHTPEFKWEFVGQDRRLSSDGASGTSLYLRSITRQTGSASEDKQLSLYIPFYSSELSQYVQSSQEKSRVKAPAHFHDVTTIK